jgi:hypothetical protein
MTDGKWKRLPPPQGMYGVPWRTWSSTVRGCAFDVPRQLLLAEQPIGRLQLV